jgi:hypothetical protein
MKKLALIILVLVMFTTCRKAELKGKYFAFGSSYNMAIGDGLTFFLIKNGNLYSDNMDRSNYKEEWTFNNDKLSKDKYKLAKQLLDKLPDYFKDNGSDTFGCPDCADQGAYHIKIGEHNSIKTFHIDTKVSTQPAEIREFIVSLSSTLKQLK